MAFPGRGWRERSEVELKEFYTEQQKPILELTEALAARHAAFVRHRGGEGLLCYWTEQVEGGGLHYSMGINQGFPLDTPNTFLKVESKMPVGRIDPAELIDGSYPLQLFLHHRGRRDFLGIIGGPGWQEAIEYGAYGIQLTDDPPFVANLILEATAVERRYTNGAH